MEKFELTFWRDEEGTIHTSVRNKGIDLSHVIGLLEVLKHRIIIEMELDDDDT